MYVQDPTQMSSQVLALLQHNPFTAKLRLANADIVSYLARIDQHTRNIASYLAEAEKTKINLNIDTQKKKMLEKEVKHLQRALEGSQGDFDAKFLKPVVMEGFFNSLGMKFINLSIKQNAEEATLSFIRPARMIEGLPVQPMLVTLEYKRRDNLLVLQEPSVKYCISNETNVHPHIQSGGNRKICLGNFFDVMNANNYSLLLDGYQEHVIMIDNLLSTYNPGSPYMTIDEILTNFINNDISFRTDLAYSVDNYNSYTFRSSKLNTSRTGYPVHDLIGEEHFRDYYAMMGNITKGSIVSDCIDRINLMQASGDYGDDYDYMSSSYSDLRELYRDVDFKDPDLVCDYSDEYDRNVLYESDFDNLKADWIKLLQPMIKDTTPYTFDMPDLAPIFAPIVPMPQMRAAGPEDMARVETTTTEAPLRPYQEEALRNIQAQGRSIRPNQPGPAVQEIRVDDIGF